MWRRSVICVLGLTIVAGCRVAAASEAAPVYEIQAGDLMTVVPRGDICVSSRANAKMPIRLQTLWHHRTNLEGLDISQKDVVPFPAEITGYAYQHPESTGTSKDSLRMHVVIESITVIIQEQHYATRVTPCQAVAVEIFPSAHGASQTIHLGWTLTWKHRRRTTPVDEQIREAIGVIRENATIFGDDPAVLKDPPPSAFCGALLHPHAARVLFTQPCRIPWKRQW